MGEEDPGRVPNQLFVEYHGQTYEDAVIEGEDVDVVCATAALAISGFESQGFIFAENVRRKGLGGQTLHEGVFDTGRPPQYEFSNLQILSLTFLSEFLCWPVIEFY